MTASNTAQSQLPVRFEFEPARRLLRISFHGNVTAPDLHAAAEHMRERTAEFGADFVLLTDLSDLQEMAIDGVRDLTRVMDLCLEAGVKEIVRVIPDPTKDIGFHLLSMTHYRGRVPITTCESLVMGT
jgi:hypothetical protein